MLPDVLSNVMVAIAERHIQAFLAEHGLDRAGSIPDDMTFRQWCQMLGDRGLKVDGQPFTLENRKAMWFVYDQIPTTREEAFGRIVVMQKCAQVGFTVMEMLASLYMSLKFEPLTTGMFVPGQALALLKSSERFMPIVRLVPEAYQRLIAERVDGSRGSEGNVTARRIGGSLTLFLWTSGKTTTESTPMGCLTYDEVQEMSIADMEKTSERLSASTFKFTLMGSTANWPGEDINHWYKRGTQHRFHTRCPSCGESTILDDFFPGSPEKPGVPAKRCCIQWDADTREWRYECPHCHGVLLDTQDGEWVPDAPAALDHKGRGIISLHFPQLLSPTITPREFMEAYNNATNLKNFFNRKLGKPFTDPSQVPVTLEHLNACMAKGVAHGLVWKKSARNTFAGIDNMGGFSCIIILERLDNGIMALIHAEQIHDIDPWKRLSVLMKLYGVAVCVCEQLPNYDSAKKFAFKHLGKVFLVSAYKVIEDDMLQWGDAGQSKADRKTEDEHRDTYTVSLDQYKMMDWTFARITSGTLWTPAANELQQEILVKKTPKMVLLLREVLWEHFMRTALVTEKDEDEHKMKRSVRKIGIDPHFSFALMMACAAWCRAYGTGTFILPDMGVGEATAAAAVERNMPGLPAAVLGAMQDLPQGVCGRCTHFAANHCQERGLNVGALDASCPLYTKVEPDDAS